MAVSFGQSLHRVSAHFKTRGAPTRTMITGPPRDSPTNESSKRFARAALSLFMIAWIASISIGIAAYRSSRARILDTVARQNLRTSETLVTLAAANSSDAEGTDVGRAMQSVIDTWSKTEAPVQGSYMCILRKPGIVAYHSKRSDMVGRDASNVLVEDPEGQIHKVGSLLENQASVGGKNSNIRGIEQLVGYAYSDSIDGLVVTHIPLAVLDGHIRKTVVPWAVALSVLTLILIPGTVVSLFHTSRKSWLRSETAMQALRCSELELQHNIAQLSQIYRQCPVGLCQLDSHLRIVRSNKVSASILDLDANSMVGSKVEDVLTGFSPDPVPLLRNLLKQRRPIVKLYVRRKRQDKSDGQHLISFHLIQDGSVKDANVSVLIEDITEAKEREQAVQSLSKVFIDSIDAIVIGDLDGNVVEMNRAAEKLSGWSKDQTAGQPVTNLFSIVSGKSFPDLACDAFNGKEVRGVEGYQLTKTGDRIPITFTISRLSTTDSQQPLIAIFAENISLRRKAETELKLSRHELACLGKVTSDVIVRFNTAGIIDSVNDSVTSLFGYSPKELSGIDFAILFPPANRREISRLLRQQANESAASEVLCHNKQQLGRCKSGKIFPISIAITYVGDDDTYACSIRDMSEVKKLERAICESTEKEQIRIGQEMHDSVQQRLVGLKLLASSLIEKQDEEQASDDTHSIHRMITVLSETTEEIRDICKGLIGNRLDNAGLPETLRELARSVEKIHGIDCHFYDEGTEPQIPSDISTHLFRIAQEATTNALKHGRATKLKIRITSTQSCTRLEIYNNGLSLREESFPHGIGLKTMYHRASLIRGILSIESTQNGTTVACEVPTGSSN